MTYVVPLQDPLALDSWTTSQYEPSGSEVVNDVLHWLSPLLIATKPISPAQRDYQQIARETPKSNRGHVPRPNAIWLELGATQLLRAAVPTALRHCTIPVKATQRCWQSQPFAPPVPLHVPAPASCQFRKHSGWGEDLPPFGAQSSVVE